jgi:hypothetical protein
MFWLTWTPALSAVWWTATFARWTRSLTTDKRFSSSLAFFATDDL